MLLLQFDWASGSAPDHVCQFPDDPEDGFPVFAFAEGEGVADVFRKCDAGFTDRRVGDKIVQGVAQGCDDGKIGGQGTMALSLFDISDIGYRKIRHFSQLLLGDAPGAAHLRQAVSQFLPVEISLCHLWDCPPFRVSLFLFPGSGAVLPVFLMIDPIIIVIVYHFHAFHDYRFQTIMIKEVLDLSGGWDGRSASGDRGQDQKGQVGQWNDAGPAGGSRWDFRVLFEQY